MREYWLVRPHGARRSFSIVERIDGKRHSIVQDARIDSVNKLYKDGIQDEQVCEQQLKSLIAEFKGNEAPRYTDANLDLLARYWENEYLERRIEESSRESRYNAFKRALAVLGAVELATATERDLLKALKGTTDSQAKTYAGCYQALLKFIGRPTSIRLGLKESPIPNHLKFEEFKQFVNFLPDEFKILAWVGFGTGCRFGEIFALTTIVSKVRPEGIVWNAKIDWQRTKNWTQKMPKRKKRRTASVIPECVEWVQKWIAVPENVKREMRLKIEASKIVRKACAKWGVKSICFHDLRHSYAIHLLSKCVGLTQVARSLGDGEAVTQLYYTGYSMEDDEAFMVGVKLLG